MAYGILVIGASWGGLHALSRLAAGLPADFPVPVAIVQHRSKDSESFLASLLQDHTALTVSEVEDKEPILPGHLYIAPPDYHLLIDGAYFSLTVDAPVKFSRPSIDVTFVSAADAFGPRAAGVVLTGANDDGSRGLRRIADRGGLTVVQRPETAEVRTMPQAALRLVPEATVLELGDIPGYLVRAMAPAAPRASGRRPMAGEGA